MVRWPRSFITLDSARAAQHKQLTLALVSNYQRSPFQITIESNQPELANKFDVVTHQVSSELAVGFGFLDRYEIGVGVPVTLYMKGTDYSSVNGQPNGDLSAAGHVITSDRVDAHGIPGCGASGSAHATTGVESNAVTVATTNAICRTGLHLRKVGAHQHHVVIRPQRQIPVQVGAGPHG